MTRGFFALGLISIFLLSESAVSEIRDRTMLTFESFLTKVDGQHPEKAIDEDMLESAKVESRRSGFLGDPQLRLGRDEVPFQARLQPNKKMAEQEQDAAQWKIGITQIFPWPGTLAAEEEAVQAKVEGIKVDNSVSSLVRRLEAADLFIRIIKTAKLLALEKEDFQAVDSIRELAQNKFKQGVGSHHEFLQAHSESAILALTVSSLETDLLNLKRHALYLLNDSTLKSLDQVEFEKEWPSKFLVQTPLEKKTETDLAAQKNQLIQKSILARDRLEYKRSLPSIMASGEMMKEDSGMRMYGVAVGITLPLFSHIQRNALESEIKLSQKINTATNDSRNRLKTLAAEQVESRISQLRTNLERIDSTVLPPLREHIEATTAQFSQGKIDIGAIIDARRAYVNLQIAEVQTIDALIHAYFSQDRIAAGLIEGEVDIEVPRIGQMSQPSNMAPMQNSAMKPFLKNRASGKSLNSLPVSPLQEEDNGNGSDKEVSPDMGM